MGCSASSLATSTSAATTAAAAAAAATAAASATAAAGEKDAASLFFCLSFRRSRRRRCSQPLAQQQDDSTGDDSNIHADDLLAHVSMACNQSLLNPGQTKNEADYDRMSSGKKDSIVTVAALGSFTHHVVRRATGSTGTSATSSSGGGSRPGHRKSSLALTPEDETMDTHQHLEILDSSILKKY